MYYIQKYNLFIAKFRQNLNFDSYPPEQYSGKSYAVVLKEKIKTDSIQFSRRQLYLWI